MLLGSVGIRPRMRFQVDGQWKDFQKAERVEDIPPVATIENIYIGKTVVIDDDFLRKLGQFGFVKHLFIYDQSQITSQGVRYISSLPQLETFSVSRCPKVGDDAMAPLANANRLGNLTLEGNSFTGNVLSHLTNHPTLFSLELEGLSALDAHAAYFPQLKQVWGLELKRMPLGSATLTAATQMPNLWNLKMSHCQIEDQAWQSLQGATKIKDLTLLNIPITPRASDALVGMPNLSNLGFPQCPIDDAALKILATIPTITSFDLTYTSITDRGIADLVQSKPDLRWLSVSGCDITDRALPDLIRLQSLQSIGIGATRLSPASIQTLQVQLPKCRVDTGQPTRR